MFGGKRTIWIALLVAAAIVGYLVYSMLTGAGNSTSLTPNTELGDNTEVSVVAVDASGTEAASTGAAAESFVRILSSIGDVKLSGGIFNDPVFTSYLQDFSRSLPERNAGRDNPFAPIRAAEIAARQTSTSSASGTTTLR